LNAVKNDNQLYLSHSQIILAYLLAFRNPGILRQRRMRLWRTKSEIRIPHLRQGSSMKHFFASLFLTARFFFVLAALAALALFGFYVPLFFVVMKILFIVFLALLLTEALLLYASAQGSVAVRREVPERFSNGDNNPVYIHIENRYAFPASLVLIDELPFQFQKRDFRYSVTIPKQASSVVRYVLRPLKRGEYAFGSVNLYASSPIGLLARRFQTGNKHLVKTYPSFIQMRQYELLAISNKIQDVGMKKIRRLGHTLEFERIREYVTGDDVRSLNWKATARSTKLMVNQYQDERSQPVYSILDLGRAMKMPFEGMSLLDYAINASLVISNIALRKNDRAGILTLSHQTPIMLGAERTPSQINSILNLLYNLHTEFKEPDYEALYVFTKRMLHQRSLLLLFTNFETLAALERQLPYLRKLAQNHLLVTIFFENTELRALLAEKPATLEAIYIQTMAEKIAYEKREIAARLRQYGIQSIYTPPQELSISVINKYLELKSRGLI
jgi:uncharacterized protein (DUF58 family)